MSRATAALNLQTQPPAKRQKTDKGLTQGQRAVAATKRNLVQSTYKPTLLPPQSANKVQYKPGIYSTYNAHQLFMEAKRVIEDMYEVVNVPEGDPTWTGKMEQDMKSWVDVLQEKKHITTALQAATTVLIGNHFKYKDRP